MEAEVRMPRLCASRTPWLTRAVRPKSSALTMSRAGIWPPRSDVSCDRSCQGASASRRADRARWARRDGLIWCEPDRFADDEPWPLPHLLQHAGKVFALDPDQNEQDPGEQPLERHDGSPPRHRVVGHVLRPQGIDQCAEGDQAGNKA